MASDLGVDVENQSYGQCLVGHTTRYPALGSGSCPRVLDAPSLITEVRSGEGDLGISISVFLHFNYHGSVRTLDCVPHALSPLNDV